MSRSSIFRSLIGRKLARASFGAAALFAGACSDPQEPSSDLASATVALTSVPADVGCVKINVVGTRSVYRAFDVKAGVSSILSLGGLPTGPAQFIGSAYPGACAAVASSTVPSWVGDPVTATLEVGRVAAVTVTLRPNGRGVVAVDFQGDGADACLGKEPGCLDPEDAFGAATDPLPPGARVVAASELARAVAAGELVLTGPRREEMATKAADAEHARDLETVKKLLANRPESLDALLAPPKEGNGLRRRADGTYELTLAPDRNGLSQRVVTMGERFAIAEVASSLSRFGTAQNQLAVYGTFWEAMPDSLRTQLQLPDPGQIAQLPAETLLQINQRLLAHVPTIRDLLSLDLPPPGYPRSCSGEEGAPSVATDQTGGSCRPSGLFASTRFPLKWSATCVKNQGRRGSCVAFGIAGAVEATIATKHRRWVNLSESRVYFLGKSPTTYGDGLNTTGMMNRLQSTAFTFPFESDWDYNPSWSRVDHDPMPFYTNSCVGYSGEHCSDTAHQGDLVCVGQGAYRFCALDGSAAPSSGFRMTHTAELFQHGVSAGSALGRLALALRTPLVMSFRVTPSFDGAGDDGIVSYAGPSETNRGGHAVTVVGFIDNENLPSDVPNGAGGGYFIVKNSWGQCWKDGGYVYLPYEWVNRYAYSLSTVAGIN